MVHVVAYAVLTTVMLGVGEHMLLQTHLIGVKDTDSRTFVVDIHGNATVV